MTRRFHAVRRLFGARAGFTGALLLALVFLCLLPAAAQERQAWPVPERTDTAPLPEERATMRPPRTPRMRALAPVDRCAGRTDGPCAFPRADLSGVRRIGSISWDWSDGAGGDLSFGGSAVSVSEDGQFLYIACHGGAPRRGIAKLAIPALGGKAKVVTPCQGPDENAIKALVPGWGAGAAMIGGVLEQGGRVVVSAFGTYDANGVATASHWSGGSLNALAGPFRGTVAPGLVKGHMAPIPVEFRALLGGPAYAAADYTSIISRASYGFAFTVFDPTQVTAANFPMTMLVGCPHSVPTCRTWTAWGPSTDGFEGTELAGGSFFVPRTRTIAVAEREGSGYPAPGTSGPNMEGYGYATCTPALHGTPYTVNPAEGVRWIYSCSDPANQKGNKAGPYRTVWKLYDAADLVAVKQGQANPWDVKPYAVVDVPGTAGAFLQNGAFNPVTGHYYRFSGGMSIDVYDGFGVATPPAVPTPTGTISATPMSIVAGQTVTLSGTLQDATTAVVSPRIGPVSGPTWSATDTPTAPTTYQVTATTAGGTFTATVAVDVTPPSEVCGDGLDNDLDGLTDENCAVDCVESSGAWGPGPDPLGWSDFIVSGVVETRYRERTWTQTTAAAFGGAACTWTATTSPVVERQTDSRPYTPPPPPAFIGRVRSQATYSSGGAVAGVRVTLQVPASMMAVVPARGGTVTLSLPLLDGTVERRTGTVYRVTPNYGYAGAPTDAQVVITFPVMSALAIRVDVP